MAPSARVAGADPDGRDWWFPRDMEKAIATGASDYAMLDVDEDRRRHRLDARDGLFSFLIRCP